MSIGHEFYQDLLQRRTHSVRVGGFPRRRCCRLVSLPGRGTWLQHRYLCVVHRCPTPEMSALYERQVLSLLCFVCLLLGECFVERVQRVCCVDGGRQCGLRWGPTDLADLNQRRESRRLVSLKTSVQRPHTGSPLRCQGPASAVSARCFSPVQSGCVGVRQAQGRRGCCWRALVAPLVCVGPPAV